MSKLEKMTEEESSYRDDLPKSKRSNLTFEELLKLNQTYAKALLKHSHQCKELKKRITQEDLKVIDDLLKEDILYLSFLSKNPIYKIEFQNLSTISNNILTSLKKFDYQKEIQIYERIQRINIYEMLIKSLLTTNFDSSYKKADALIEELIELEQDKEVRKYITLIRHCRAILFKAICKFYLGEVEYSKGLAFEVLEILEKNPSTHSSGKEDHQRISLMSQTIELLAEIHDLEKNKISTLDCYQKLYYLNLGKYGEENSNTKKYKKMKEQYEKDIKEQRNKDKQRKEQGRTQLKLQGKNNNNELNYYYADYSYHSENNQGENEHDEYSYSQDNYNGNISGFSKNDKQDTFQMKKLINNQYVLHKGQADTFSFRIPLTQFHEPMTISIYRKRNENGEDSHRSNHNRLNRSKNSYLFDYSYSKESENNQEDLYSNKLFMQNLYFDKISLFRYLGKNKNQDNYVLYTNEVLNLILKRIEVQGNEIYLHDDMLANSLIRY